MAAVVDVAAPLLVVLLLVEGVEVDGSLDEFNEGLGVDKGDSTN